ncbi:protein of unknown function [Parapedobacter composti]|uniref:DUF4886 domain-containing protein n=1 Tax=Parapedobacter composti TaxID=623281 RepID=A0A1I1IE01_9SPHI|nr:DUF4886 domain-containing protein [Parapedobacter composti]SFC34619.1 protein of unknown function [Parapedobacter composti]
MKNFFYTIAALVSFAGLMTAGCQKMERPEMNIIPDPPDDGTIRILAIGNSFSEDAIENYLYELAAAKDIPVIIGNLYIGGASLELHARNVSNNEKAYSYRKIGRDGKKTTVANTSIAEAMADEKWTHISFQQVSDYSGQYETWEASLSTVYNYVSPRARHPEVKFMLHQTWAYAQNSTHAAFPNYGNDQMTMYSAIVDAVNRAKNLVDIDLIVPAGTAIQNGRTSIIGDNFTRDGYHLDNNIGRYTAACAWFEAIFGESVVGNPFKPEALSDYEAEIAQQAAHLAIQQPNQVTDMVDYKDWGGSFEFLHPAFIDFGGVGGAEGWNTLSGYLAGASILNLKDMNGDFTGVTLRVEERFNGINTNGELDATAFNMPENVAKNSFFGNSKTPFNNMVVEQSVLTIAGLDTDKTYDLCYFGSRGGVGDNRETAYTAQGANEATAVINTSNNKTDVACTNGIQPDAEGVIRVTITAGPNNNNGNGFYYITAMRVSPRVR